MIQVDCLCEIISYVFSQKFKNMKPNYITILFFSILLLTHCHTMQAESSWAMVTFEDGKDWPSVAEYHGWLEKGANGVDYLRIHDYKSMGNYNPIKLRYGYRMSDKKIFVYDYDTDEERVAFDFTLSAGDHFRTYNGIEWEVDIATDTLVNISYKGEGESSTKRLLKVHSVDSCYSDQWLEDFGSFANHFMIQPMIPSGQMQTLWMEYELGCNLVRILSSDPFYTHDSGYPDYGTERGNEQESYSSIYSDGILRVEEVGWCSPNRVYSLYYRIDDELYRVYRWYISPATGAAINLWHHSISYFYGLPEPQSGKYTIHNRMDDRPNSIANPTNDTSNNLTESSIYDMQGRKLVSKPAKGIYIQQRKKKFVESR